MCCLTLRILGNLKQHFHPSNINSSEKISHLDYLKELEISIFENHLSGSELR